MKNLFNSHSNCVRQLYDPEGRKSNQPPKVQIAKLVDLALYPGVFSQSRFSGFVMLQQKRRQDSHAKIMLKKSTGTFS